MADYEESNQKFVNPYHFVSLEGNCRKDFDYHEQRKKKCNFTGWIDCEMETLTPIFIPSTSSVYEEKNGEKHSDVFGKRAGDNGIINSYDFFSYRNLPIGPFEKCPDASEPVIPGSEIRGVIRSAFEAVTNSCLSTIDDEQVLYKRVTTSGKPGRLLYENGKWKIQKCERIGISFRATRGDRHNFSKYIRNLKEGQEVYVKKGHKYKTRSGYPAFTVVDDIGNSKRNGYIKGFYHLGEPFGQRKHHESVFIPTGEKDIEIDELAVRNYVKNLKLYKDKTINLHHKKGEHSGYREIDVRNKKVEDFSNSLIYYSKYNKNYYLSPSAIGREVFYNQLTKIVGDYNPCSQLNELCCACALFGIAGKEDAAASRVRFVDAHVLEKKENPGGYYEGIRILKELASPKLSATEFYLIKNPDYADTWNYDYAINWRSNRWGIPGYKPQIRGRKFYWHHRNGAPYIKKEDEENDEVVSERNVAVRPLKKGNRFKFKVYFNNVTSDELGKLLWVLEIGQNKEHAHKIGMGKPIGLGSVRISVSNIHIRKIVRDTENNTIHYDEHDIKDRPDDYKDILNWSSMNHQNLGCSELVLKEFLHITRVDHSYDTIEYPTIEDKPENYLWFVANKQIKGTGTRPIIEQSLPPMDSPWLKKYKEKKAG